MEQRTEMIRTEYQDLCRRLVYSLISDKSRSILTDIIFLYTGGFNADARTRDHTHTNAKSAL